MKRAIGLILIGGLLVSAVAGCGKKADPKSPPDDGHRHDQGPHGGQIVELAGGTAHLEVLHDEAAGSLVLHVLDGSLKPTKITEAPVLNLKTAAGPKQVSPTMPATAEGSSEWTFRDDALKGEPESATIRITVGGKTYTPAIPHEH